MRPSVGRVSPLIRLNKVVLPAPLGPMSARRSPGPTVRLTPSTARSPPKSFERPLRLSAATAPSITSAILAGREVAVVDGLLQEFLRLVLPELRDGRVRVDDGVPELTVLLLDLANVDVLDRVAVGVELQRPARRIGDLDLLQRLQELLPVLHVAVDGLGRLVDPPRARVEGLRVIRRHLRVLLPVVRDELLVRRRIERSAVDEGTHTADRLRAERGQHELVERRPATDQGQFRLEPGVLILLGEAP